MSNEITVYDASSFNVPTGPACTIDITTDAGAIAVTNALSASEPLSEHVDEEIVVTDIIMVPAKRAVSEEPCMNTHLVLVDGTCYFSQSDGVCSAARNIIGAFGDKMHRGLRIVCFEQKLRNGNTMKSLRVLGFAD